jgi:DNA polymerase-1
MLSLELVKALFEGNKIHLGWNYHFDLRFLLFYLSRNPNDWGQYLKGIVALDAMISSHLLNENEDNFKLKDLAAKYLGETSKDEQDDLNQALLERGLRKGSMFMLDSTLVGKYAIKDVILTHQMALLHIGSLIKWQLWDIWVEESEYIQVITLMEMYGIKIDLNTLEVLATESQQKADDIKQEIEQAYGRVINLQSSKQVQAMLGLTSTASDILDKIPSDHPKYELAKAVLEYRSHAKALGTYYNKFREININGVIRASFHITGTVTGRLSCSEPNMQAIPRKNSAYKVKDVFVARDGYTFLQADYSQAEIRIASHYAQCQKMIDMLVEGVDIHTATANSLGIPRPNAKAANFSAIYGIGYKSFAHDQNIPLHLSEKYLTSWHAEYPEFRKLLQKAEETASKRHYIRLFTGRMRRYNNSIKAPEHKASSNLVQGTVGEIMRLAMSRIYRELDPRIRQVLTVHDSILFEIPKEIIDQSAQDIRAVMQDFPMFSVPILVDLSQNDVWGNMKG